VVIQTDHVIETVELELLRLVRHLETFGRRGSLYAHIDRAGYLALRTLEDVGPTSTNALARALHLDASTVTRQISALERSGFIERRPDPRDGRSTTLVLLAEGREAMYQLGLERRRRIEAVLRAWSQSERDNLAAALTMLNTSLTASVASFQEENPTGSSS
jgi:DNA-binding MarR family transcriptional regulator